MPAKFKIDPEFAALLPAKPPEEYDRLAIAIELEGCAPGSLVVGSIPGEGRFLLDGHNTYSICQAKRLPVTEPRIVNLPNREAAIEWIVNNQLARRNLTDEQRAYFIGKKYTARKGTQGGSRSKGQCDTLVNAAAEIATEAGVSERTVKRNAEFAEAVDAIGEKAPEVKAAILNGTAGVSKQDVIDTPPSSLFCDRCRRVGVVKDCDRCAEMRAQPGRSQSKPKPTKPPSTNGAPVFNLRTFRDHCGQASAELNKLLRAVGLTKPTKDGQVAPVMEVPQIAGLQRRIEEWYQQGQQIVKDAEKVAKELLARAAK